MSYDPKQSLENLARARESAGEKVDSKDIRKHGNDVIRLSQLLAPEMQISIGQHIADDLGNFLKGLAADDSHNPKELQIDLSLAEFVERVQQAYAFPGT